MIEGSSAFLPPLVSAQGDAATTDLFRNLPASAKGGVSAGLSKEEQAEVAELKRRDAETRRHEQAHANAGGQYAGTPSYTYERGPNGRSYAVAGTTPIDVSPVPNDPAATQRKMQVVKRAALAPGEPSPQDRKVAAQAEAERLKAQAELNAGKADELSGQGEDNSRQIGAGGHAVSAYTGGGAPRQPSVSPLFDLFA